MAVVIQFIAAFCHYVFSRPRQTNSTVTNMWGSEIFLHRTGSSHFKRVGTYATRNGTMIVNGKFSYEQKASSPRRSVPSQENVIFVDTPREETNDLNRSTNNSAALFTDSTSILCQRPQHTVHKSTNSRSITVACVLHSIV